MLVLLGALKLSTSFVTYILLSLVQRIKCLPVDCLMKFILLVAAITDPCEVLGMLNVTILGVDHLGWRVLLYDLCRDLLSVEI